MRTLVVLIPLLLVSCGLPRAVCTTGTAFTGETDLYVDRSAAWGLDALGATGTRISAVDYDGDGWPDLVVRAVGSVGDAPDARTTWLLRNTGEGRFEDVTASSGLWAPRRRAGDRGRPGSVVAFADVDGDGDLDAFTGVADLDAADPADETHEILLQGDDGTFALAPRGSGVRRAVTNASGAAFADVDLDGVVDLWLTDQGGQDRLLRGLGDGTFEDVTGASGLATEPWTDVAVINEARAHSNAWSAAACDLSGDGRPELLAASYGRAPNHLWLAGDDGGFTNHSVASGYAFDDRTDWTDNESARCWCSLHPDDEDCEGVPEPGIACSEDADAFRWSHDSDREPFRLGGNSGTTVCADVDADGHLDLLTTEIVHWDVGSSSDPSELLFHDGGDRPTFSRPGNEVTGLVRSHEPGWNDGDITGAVLDMDNDGLPDVLIASTDYPDTRAQLYRQAEPRRFEAVRPRRGIDHPRAHGVAVADFDRDGDLDVVLGHSRSRCDGECYPVEEAHVRLFENQLGQDGNWLQLDLRGVTANRAAIGARVTVRVGDRVQVLEVGGGHGHYGMQHDLVQHVGLGTACEAEVTVRWPAEGLPEQTVTLPAGHRFRWVEGERPEAVD